MQKTPVMIASAAVSDTYRDQVLAGQGRHDGGDDGAGRGIGRDDQLAGRAQKGVSDERQEAGVQPVDRGNAGQLRVGDGDRHGHRGHRYARQKIVAEPALLISRQRPIMGAPFSSWMRTRVPATAIADSL